MTSADLLRQRFKSDPFLALVAEVNQAVSQLDERLAGRWHVDEQQRW